jgi:hypothetical protein
LCATSHGSAQRSQPSSFVGPQQRTPEARRKVRPAAAGTAGCRAASAHRLRPAASSRGDRSRGGPWRRCGRRTPGRAPGLPGPTTRRRTAGSAARSRAARPPRTRGREPAPGTIHRWTCEVLPRPIVFSGASTFTLWSGAQSPMSQSCETTRVPGASASRRGRNCRLTSGNRYIVMTLARLQVGLEQVLLAKLDPVLHRGRRARSRLRRHQVGHDLDAQSARAEAPGGGDDDAAIARTEIDHVIARTDRRELQHRERHRVGRGHERHLVLRRCEKGEADSRAARRGDGKGFACVELSNGPGDRRRARAGGGSAARSLELAASDASVHRSPPLSPPEANPRLACSGGHCRWMPARRSVTARCGG